MQLVWRHFPFLRTFSCSRN